MVDIVSIRTDPLDIELNQPFGIAGGSQVVARNVLVEIELADGTIGLGEAAPFEAVSGETQASVLSAIERAKSDLMHRDARSYRTLSALMWELLQDTPTAVAALEIALLDALARRAGTSLLHWFGGAETTLCTDITIPTSDDADPVRVAAESARLARSRGFRTLKLKVGKDDLDTEAKRVRAVAEAAPMCRLILDANCSYDVKQALDLVREIGELRASIAVFEQPVAREDWLGLTEVEAKGGIRVCADESFKDANDLARLVNQGGPSTVNIKTAKSGLVRAWDLALSAKSLGFQLMVGGMVETELSMSASACMAAGIGGFSFVDLDTPLFMRERPLQGGFRQHGPDIRLDSIRAGHGVRALSRCSAQSNQVAKR